MKSRGSQALLMIPGTAGAKASALGVERSLVAKVQNGDRAASEEVRRKCFKTYGIALEAWDEPALKDGAEPAPALAVAVSAPEDADTSVFARVANYLTKAGEWTGRGSIQRLAKECNVSEAAIEYAVGWVATELAAQRGSVAVNKEASIAFCRAVARKAFEDKDWKTALAAHDRLVHLTGVMSKSGVHDHDDQGLRLTWSTCVKMLREPEFAKVGQELQRRLMLAQDGAHAGAEKNAA